MVKHQQLKDDESNEIESRVSKHYYSIDMCDNEEWQVLDGFQGENNVYVSLLFIAPHLSPRKDLNQPIDLTQGSKNLNQLICIPKIG